MKRILFIVFLISHFSFLIPSGWAQKDSINQISVGLEFVTHGEVCGGGLPRAENEIINEDHSQFLFGRTRINVDYERPGLQAHAVIQNMAVWGSSGNQSLDLYEGWVKMTAKNGLFVQAGRVALAYDDERIIGLNDFATAALSHDIIRAGYEGHGHKFHAILAYNQNGSNVYNGTYYDGGAQEYKTMQTVWYHYDVPKFPLGASLLFMNLGLQAGGYKQVKNMTVEDESNPPRTEHITLMAGYTQMYGTETMACLKQDGSSKSARWGWFTLVVSPSLFSAKW